MKIEGFAPSIQLRYNFTYNFLVGAAAMARLAKKIEEKGKVVNEAEQLEHKAFVAGSIMQAVAALESDIWSLLNHGPGHHLGSDGLDRSAQLTLGIVADTFEKESILKKCDLILQLIRSRKLDMGIQPMQDLKLLVGLRNEITHFKSHWTDEIESKVLFEALKIKDSTRPLYYPDGFMNFFPGICLNYIRAKWAVYTVIDFIDYFYAQIDMKSPLDIFDRKLLSL